MSKVEKRLTKRVPISEALRGAIRRLGLTAYAVAKGARVSVDAVQRFLNRERGLTLATVDKVAASLSLTLCTEEVQGNERKQSAAR